MSDTKALIFSDNYITTITLQDILGQLGFDVISVTNDIDTLFMIINGDLAIHCFIDYKSMESYKTIDNINSFFKSYSDSKITFMMPKELDATDLKHPLDLVYKNSIKTPIHSLEVAEALGKNAITYYHPMVA